MKRRQAIAYTAALIGGTLASTNFLLSGCKPEERTNGLFTTGDLAVSMAACLMWQVKRRGIEYFEFEYFSAPSRRHAAS